MPIYDDTIVAYRKNSKYCIYHEDGECDNEVAHFHNCRYQITTANGPRICIQQEFLFWAWTIATHKTDGPNKVPIKSQKKMVTDGTFFKHLPLLDGNFALIEIVCHELAHFTQLGHSKKFLKVYLKFLSQITGLVISGMFYRSLFTIMQRQTNDS